MEKFCPGCGLIQDTHDSSVNCKICRTRFEHEGLALDITGLYGIDFTRLGLVAYLKVKLAEKSKLLYGPIETVRYFVRKIIYGDLVKLLYRSKTVKFRRVVMKDTPVREEDFIAVTALFKSAGFVAALDRKMESSPAENYQRVFYNEKKSLFAFADFFPEDSSSFITVSALRGRSKGLFVATTKPPDGSSDPRSETLFIQNGKLEKLVSLVRTNVQSGEKQEGASAGPVDFFVEYNNSARRAFTLLLDKGALVRLDDPGSGEDPSPFCAVHSDTMAVRVCKSCGKSLCELCFQNHLGEVYCTACIPSVNKDESKEAMVFDNNVGPAGFFLRSSVKLVEISFILFLLTLMFPDDSRAGSKIAFLTLCAPTIFLYFYLPLSRFGATPAQRLAGISVLDESGSPIAKPSAILRTGYLFLTLLTIIPAIGYLEVLINKKRRGWHDHLAGTIVVTSNTARKEMIGIVTLLLMTGASILNWNAIQGYVTYIAETSFRGAGMGDYVAIVPRWLVEKTSSQSFMDRKRVVVVRNGLLANLAIENGDVVWNTKITGITDAFFDPYSSSYSIFGRNNKGAYIGGVSNITGSVTWLAELEEPAVVNPVFYPKGVIVATGKKVTSYYSGSGKKDWESIMDQNVTRLYFQNGSTLVQTGDGDGVVIIELNSNSGERVAKIENFRLPQVQYSGDELILSSDNEIALTRFPVTRRKWTAVGKAVRKPVVEKSALIHATRKAINRSDGSTAFNYPDDCYFAGVVMRSALLTCPGEGKVMAVNKFSGTTIKAYNGPRLDHVRLLSEKAESIYAVGFQNRGGDSVKVFLITLSHGLGNADFTTIGDFTNEPEIKYLEDQKALFIASGLSVGLYELPWSE